MKNVFFALALLAFSQLALAQQGGAASSASGQNYNGFYANVLLSNFKWCSSQPIGASCEEMAASCSQISSVFPVQGYYAYLELPDIVHANGAYDYETQAYYTKPDGSEWYNGGWNDKGSQQNGYRCRWFGFPSTSFTTPSGTWKHEFKVTDNLASAPNNVKSTYQTIEVSCNADAQCAGGLACRSNSCSKVADLTVTDIYTSPEQPVGGFTTAIIGVIKNTGLAAVAKGFNNLFYSDGSRVTARYYTQGVQPSQEAAIQPPAVVLEAGRHEITAYADADSEVDEVRDDNNQLSKNFTWLSTKPDLVLSSLQVNPSPPTTGQKASLSITVSNAMGKELLDSSWLDLFVDGQKEASYILFSIPASGRTFNHWLDKTAGTHSIKIVVDARNNVSESNENNNQNTTTITWNAQTPLTQTIEGIATEYYTGDAITANITVRKQQGGGPVEGAAVSVRDSFGGGVTLSTNAQGKTQYTATASKNGVNYVELASSKASYATLWQRYSFKVLDYNARIQATVHTPKGQPVAGAKLYRNNQQRATTDGNGSAYFTTTRGLNNIQAYCPDNSYCSAKLANVQSTSFLDFTCDCKLSLVSINATWVNASSELNGKPVAALQILEGDRLIGNTGLNGVANIGNVAEGEHYFTIVGLFPDAAGNCTQKKAKTIQANVSITKQTINIPIDPNSLFNPTSQAASAYSDPLRPTWSNYTPTFFPIVMFAVGCMVVASQVYFMLSPAADTAIALSIGDDIERANQCRLTRALQDCPLEAIVAFADVTPLGELGTATKTLLGLQIAGKTFKMPIIGTVVKVGKEIIEATGTAKRIPVTSKLGAEIIEQEIRVNAAGEISTRIIINAAGAVKEAGQALTPALKVTGSAKGVTILGELVPKTELVKDGSEIRNVKGAIGEAAARKLMGYLKQLAPDLEIIFHSIPTGVKETEKFKFVQQANGAIKVIAKEGQTTRDFTNLDLVIFVKGKPVITEVKAGKFTKLDKISGKQIPDNDILDDLSKQLDKVYTAGKALFDGEEAEHLLIVASDQVDLVKDIAKAKGFKVMSFTETSLDFDKAVKAVIGGV